MEWNTGMTLSLCFFFPEAVVRVCMALNGSEWLSGSIKYIHVSAVCQSAEQTEPRVKTLKPGV